MRSELIADRHRDAVHALLAPHRQSNIKADKNKEVRTGLRLVARYGAATVQEVVSEVSGQSIERTVDLLDECAGIRWLDETSEWFWCGPYASPAAMDPILKVFALTDRIQLADLRSAVARVHPTDRPAPPEAVYREMALQHPALDVDGGEVRIQDPRAIEPLSLSERLLVQIFREQGPVLKVDDINSLWSEYGSSPSRLNQVMLESPVLQRLTHGYYALAGDRFGPAALEARRRRRRTGKLLDLHFGENEIRMTLRVTSRMWRHGLCEIPIACASHLAGTYLVAQPGPNGPDLVRMPDGEPCILKVTKAQAFTRFMHVLRATNTEVDDVVQLTCRLNQPLAVYQKLNRIHPATH